jgi:hypothetical protein
LPPAPLPPEALVGVALGAPPSTSPTPPRNSPSFPLPVFVDEVADGGGEVLDESLPPAPLPPEALVGVALGAPLSTFPTLPRSPPSFPLPVFVDEVADGGGEVLDESLPPATLSPDALVGVALGAAVVFALDELSPTRSTPPPRSPPSFPFPVFVDEVAAGGGGVLDESLLLAPLSPEALVGVALGAAVVFVAGESSPLCVPGTSAMPPRSTLSFPLLFGDGEAVGEFVTEVAVANGEVADNCPLLPGRPP